MYFFLFFLNFFLFFYAFGDPLFSRVTKVAKKTFKKIFQSYFLLSKPTYPDKSGRATSLVRKEFSPDKGMCSAELVGFVSIYSDRERFFNAVRVIFFYSYKISCLFGIIYYYVISLLFNTFLCLNTLLLRYKLMFNVH